MPSILCHVKSPKSTQKASGCFARYASRASFASAAVGDGLDGAGDGDAGVRGALEAWGGDGEGAFAVRLEVAGVPAHG